MNDRLPGTTWDNPLWEGKWRIFLSSEHDPQLEFACVHDDYGGAPDANDNRVFYGPSVEICRKYARDWDEDHAL